MPEVKIHIRAIDEASGTFQVVGREAQTLGSRFGYMGRIASIAGGVMGAYFGVSAINRLVGGLEEGIRTFASFEENIVRAGQASGLAGDELEEFREEAAKVSRLLGVDFAVGAEEVSRGMLALTKAGVSGEEAIGAITASLQFAKIAGVSTEEAVRVLALAMNAFDVEAEDATGIVDSFVRADDLMIGSFDEMIAGFLNVAGVANQFGLSLEETLGSLILVSNELGSGAEGGTALARALESLLKNQKKFGDLLFDTQGSLRPFVDILQDVQYRLEGLSGEQERLDFLFEVFSEIRARRFANALYDVSDASDEGMSNLLEYTAALQAASGDAESRVEELKDTTRFALDEMNAAWEDLSLSVGQLVAGPLTDLMESLTDLIQVASGAKTQEEAMKEARAEFFEETSAIQRGETPTFFSWLWEALGLGPDTPLAKWLRENVPGFQHGGVMPHTGLAWLEAGEVVLPAGRGGVHIGRVEMRFSESVDGRRVAEEFLRFLDQEAARR